MPWRCGVVLSRRPIIDVEDLPDTLRGTGSGTDSNGNQGAFTAVLGLWLRFKWQCADCPGDGKRLDADALNALLAEPSRNLAGGLLRHRHGTARNVCQLDINRTTLYKKIKQYGLEELVDLRRPPRHIQIVGHGAVGFSDASRPPSKC